jgi:hypothetical protein
MPALSSAALADLVRRRFPAGTVAQTGLSIRVTAYAVARAESGGRPEAVGDAGTSFGLWQINLPSHPQWPGSWLLEPENNASAAYIVSGAGSNWNPWCTFEPTACGRNGNQRYRGYLAEAAAALTEAPPPPPPPAGRGWALLLGLAGLALFAYAASDDPA